MIKRAIQYTIQKDRNRMKLKTKKVKHCLLCKKKNIK